MEETNLSEERPIFDDFKDSGKYLLKSCVSFARFSYRGTKWLFTKHPNKTWGVIVLCLGMYYLQEISKARMERDSYSVENAELIDSLDKIKRPQVKNISMSNKPIIVKPIIKKDGSKKD